MRPTALLLLCLASCGILGTTSREEMVRQVREFNNDLRWGRHDLVTPRLAPAARARYQAQLALLGEDLEILDHEVMALDLLHKGDQAAVRVELSWTNRRTGLVERTTVMQFWEVKGSMWMVNRQERVRGTPLALFDEPKAPRAEPPRAGPPSKQP